MWSAPQCMGCTTGIRTPVIEVDPVREALPLTVIEQERVRVEVDVGVELNDAVGGWLNVVEEVAVDVGNGVPTAKRENERQFRPYG